MTEIIPSLSELEIKAHNHIDIATDNWLLAIETIQHIKDSNLWRSKSNTWADYFAQEFQPKVNYSYSRLRQFIAALPLAQYIQAETGVILSEGTIRAMRKNGYGQSLETLEVVKRAKLASDEMGQSLQAKHIKATEETLREISATGCNISLDENTIPTNKPLDPVQVAIVQKAHEANERQSEYIKEGSTTKIQGIVEAVHNNHGEICLAVVIKEASLEYIGKTVFVYLEIEQEQASA